MARAAAGDTDATCASSIHSGSDPGLGAFSRAAAEFSKTRARTCSASRTRSAASFTSALSLASVCLAMGVAAAACCATANGSPPACSFFALADASALTRSRSASFSFSAAEAPGFSKNFSRPSCDSGASASAATSTASRLGPPQGPFSPPRWCVRGNARRRHAAFGNFGSAHLCALASRGPDTASVSRGGSYAFSTQCAAKLAGSPPGRSRNRSRRNGCTRRSNMPMAPSCVNTAAIRADIPRSSTLGAWSARNLELARARRTDISVPRFRLCSGGTKRSSAAPHRCGSSVGNTRSGTVPVRSSNRSGKPCAPSSANEP